ncbi:hypothetical protein ABID99_003575 [Mucilaginibacter sp. OAE612]|uniref:hypothetical protein n=1 Tax=Mucilaginibacter sp. OAE612 TaxID=3156444 RepID=UPI00359F0C4B
MANYPITITLDKEVHHFEVGEYPHHDETRCRYHVYEGGSMVASFEPDAQDFLHICQNKAGFKEELLYLLADQIEAQLQHPGNKHLDFKNKEQ